MASPLFTASSVAWRSTAHHQIQCDEGFPECRECLSFSVCCNYDIRVPDLQPRNASNRKLNGKMQTYKVLVTSLKSAEESKLELIEGNVSRLQRYKMRTALTLGPPELRQLYENEVYRLMFRVRLPACRLPGDC